QHSLSPALLADAVLKSFLALALAGAVIVCCHRIAASTRHLIWFLAMTALLWLPVCSYLIPKWQRPLWTVGTHSASGNELTFTLEFAPARPGAPAAGPSPALSAPSQTTIPFNNASSGRQLAAKLSVRWVAFGLLIWFAGATTLLFSAIFGRWRLRILRNKARALSDPEWVFLLKALRKELRLQRRVVLLRSTDDVMPVTWGWFKPIILLPAQAAQWAPERRRLVLLHELAHVKRWDCLTQWVARVVCSLYWFNPLVWLAARRMCVERERACDDLVLAGGCKASDYATHLVEIARSFMRVPQVAAIAMARSSNLESRVAAIVDASRRRCGPSALLVVTLCSVGLGFLAAVAAQKPQVSLTSASHQSSTRPWFDERLRTFFTAKAAQARQLAGGERVAREVWTYFDAGMKGDWSTATNLWVAMRHRAHQYEGTTPDDTLDKVWS